MVYFPVEVMSMDFYTVTDLRTASKRVWESLSAQGHVVITNNGKPTALMIDIADNNPEEVLAAVRQAQAMRAMNRLQADSLRRGLDGLTEEDIETEISAARKGRKRKINVAGGR